MRKPTEPKFIAAGAIIASIAALGAISLLLFLRREPLFVENATMENTGEICLVAPTTHYLSLTATVKPGCLSTSCTRTLEQSGNVQVDLQNKAIRFFTRFVFMNPLGRNAACTADCGGGGGMQFVFTVAQEGLYSVWLGTKQIGQIQLPSQGQKTTTCFPDHKPRPTETYSGPTQTPWPIRLPTIEMTEIPGYPLTPYP